MKTLKKGVVKTSGSQENIHPGWIVELAYDGDSAGGYYLFFSNPRKGGGAFDDWFLTKEEALFNLDYWEMEVNWNSSST